MPIPVLVWVGVVILTGGGGVGLLVSAKKRVDRARARYEARRKDYDRHEAACRTQQSDVDREVQELGKLKLAATQTLAKAAEAIRKAKVKDRQFGDRVDISEETLLKWQDAGVKATEVMLGVGGALTSGALTAAGVYGLVGLLGAASTGTAIASLSGVAATNATLAWLGGGALAAGGGGMAAGTAVLGGVVVGPALLVSGFFAQAKASKVETEVESHLKEMAVAEAKMHLHQAYLDAVRSRAAEIFRAVGGVKDALDAALATSEDIALIARLAVSLGKLLDAKVLAGDGTPVPVEGLPHVWTDPQASESNGSESGPSSSQSLTAAHSG